MNPDVQVAIALLIVAVSVYLVVRRVDVRLVLFTAALALGTLALRPWVIFDEFLREMANGNTIGPICSAMGYAFILRAIGADREMVRLLIRPIRRIRWLLIPGGCTVGFFTNMAITSQTAVAAAVGPILVPLMLAAGFHPIIVAATLVLGCSVGGSLYNPGEAVVVNIAGPANVHVSNVLDRMFVPELLGFFAATITFTILSRREPKEAVQVPSSLVTAIDDHQPIQLIKALLPPLPIAMLLLLQPRFNLFPPILQLYPQGLPASHAMILSAIVALFVDRKDLSAQARAFFEGTGFAYVNVISLIVTATCFIKGLEVVGLIQMMVSAIHSSGFIGKSASAFFPWVLAVLGGSGTAPCVAFCKAVLPSISAKDVTTAIDFGVLAAISSSFGRTMSPVASIVFFTSVLLNVTPLQIIRRTAPALAAAAAVVFVFMLGR
jgi:DcuC family C4-dicarboxylate transporter